MRRLAMAVVTTFGIIGVIATIHELRGQEKAPLAEANFAFLGLTVKDVDATLKVFSDVFGVPVPQTTTITPPYPPQFAGDRSAALKYARLTVGNLSMLIFQPLNGPGPHYDQLQKFGNSVQTVAFSLPNATRLQAVKALEARGGKWALGNETTKGAMYVDMKDKLGFTVELTGR